MKSIVKIIQAHGGLEALKKGPIRIDPPCPGLMQLCIEYVGKGPRDQALISIAHDFKQNGDLMADPEVTVEVPDGRGWDDPTTWGPISIAMHATGYYREAVSVKGGKVVIRAGELWFLKSFLRLWDRNIRAQGFIEAFEQQRKALP